MTVQDRRSLTDEVDDDPGSSLEMAAARGLVESSALIVKVFHESGLTQRQLAQNIGVTEGRVSQVLSGEENLGVATVARYLHAMGYRLWLEAHDSVGKVVTARRKKTTSAMSVPLGKLGPFVWTTSGERIVSNVPYINEDGTGRTLVVSQTTTFHSSLRPRDSLVPSDVVHSGSR
jgi:transcriptional regulator with XRE-family HTH domain